MNSIKTFKALSIVANVEQGELIKRLIKENKKMKLELKYRKEINGIAFYCENCGEMFYTKEFNSYPLKKYEHGTWYIDDNEEYDIFCREC